MKDDKYITFKREDFLNFFTLRSHGIDLEDMPSPIEDAVVIRRQDIFSAPALEAYANSILATVDAAASFAEVPTAEIQAKLKKLRDIADYFHDQASEAWLTVRKLPD